jgi:hypothetical protein
MGLVDDLHPYPFIENSYMAVQNFGTENAPKAKRDEEHLLVMKRVNHAPDLNSLEHFSADDATDMAALSRMIGDIDDQRVEQK